MKTVKLSAFCFLSLLGLFVAGCSNGKSASAPAPAIAPATATNPITNPPNPAPTAGGTNEVAVITTSDGVMVVEFYPDVAPKHVENFKTLAKKVSMTARHSTA